MWSVIKQNGVATSFYMYMLVPLVASAPYFPVWVYPNDGTSESLSPSQIQKNWDRAAAALRAAGICIIGHVGDGASVFR
jgi:hypothetical protein